MSFADIIGQSLPVNLLQRSLKTGRLAQAYLFHGPPGVGKELTAVTFAKALNCLAGFPDACDQCVSCREIAARKYADLTVLYPVARSRQIKIEQVRQLQQALSWKVSSGRYKIAIIMEAQTLTSEAANALLKTLEEPPADSILILITPQPESLLATIRSRTQGIQFSPLAIGVLTEILIQQMRLTPKKALLYGRLGAGSVQRAMNLQDEDIASRRQMVLDGLAEGVFSSAGGITEKTDEIIASLDNFRESLRKRLKEEDKELTSREEEEAYLAGAYKEQVFEILSLVLSWYRDLLVYQEIKDPDMLLNSDYSEKIINWSSRYDREQLCSYIDSIDEIKVGLNRNIGLKLLLQVMFVKLGM